MAKDNASLSIFYGLISTEDISLQLMVISTMNMVSRLDGRLLILYIVSVIKLTSSFFLIAAILPFAEHLQLAWLSKQVVP